MRQFWENDAALVLKDPWVQALLDSPDLRSTHILRLELETLDYKVPQLLPIVERLKGLESRQFETHRIDGQPASTTFVLQPHTTTDCWSGPSNLDWKRYEPYAQRPTLNYHAITLTWKLHFPQFPNAHVSTLRLAPRLHPGPDPIPPEELPRIYFRPPRTKPAPYPRPRRRKKAGDFSQLRFLNSGLWVRIKSVAKAGQEHDTRRAMFCAAMHVPRERTLLRFVDRDQ